MAGDGDGDGDSEGRYGEEEGVDPVPQSPGRLWEGGGGRRCCLLQVFNFLL